jgi:replicative DNA helicase
MTEQLPPHSQQVEESLLGSVIIDPDVFGSVSSIVSSSDFYIIKNRLVWEAFASLNEQSIPIDFITLTEELNKRHHLEEIGGPAFLASITNTVPTSLHANAYALEVFQQSQRRRLLNGAQDLAKLVFSANGNFRERALDVLLDLQTKLNVINGTKTFKNWSDMDEILSPISWHWPKWLAGGLFTLMVAESGSGKTALALRIAGCYLSGLPWPDGTPFLFETGCVGWCESESFQAGNLERGKKWGLPIDKILSPLENLMDDFRLDREDHKAALVNLALEERVKLVVVDSLSGSNRQSEQDTEMLSLVLWLASLARDCGKPVIVTHHLRKSGIQDVDTTVNLDRVRGSSSIVQPARLIWAIDVPDPNDKNHKRLSVIKSNLARFPDPIGITIDDTGIFFGQAPTPPKIETQTDKAVDLLTALLYDEPMKAADLEQEFKHAGIGWRTANEAKKRLGIIAIRKDNHWIWSLPARKEDE